MTSSMRNAVCASSSRRRGRRALRRRRRKSSRPGERRAAHQAVRGLDGAVVGGRGAKAAPGNDKGQELIGGEGMELRVAVQHENNLAPASARDTRRVGRRLHVLVGTATLTPVGSWMREGGRARRVARARIEGGQTSK